MIRATCLIGAMAFAGIAFFNVQVSADVIDQTNGNAADWDGVDGIFYNRWLGQSFSPDLPILTAVEFVGLGEAHAWTDMPPGNTVRAQIWSTSAGLPDVLLATVNRTSPLSTGAGPEYSGRFDLTSPLNVSAYIGDTASLFVAFSVPNASTPGEWEVLFTTGPAGSYADGSYLVSTNQGGTWNFNTTRDLSFRTYGEVPEPSMLGLLAIGGLLIARRACCR